MPRFDVTVLGEAGLVKGLDKLNVTAWKEAKKAIQQAGSRPKRNGERIVRSVRGTRGGPGGK